MVETDITMESQESRCEIKDLIQKLHIWSKEREQSQKSLDNILGLFSGTVDKDIDGKEVDDLKAQLSNVTEERNALLDANKKLDGRGISSLCSKTCLRWRVKKMSTKKAKH